MKKSITLIVVLFVAIMVSGCGETWKGAKKDTSENVEKSKDKVNDGAKYIEKKTD